MLAPLSHASRWNVSYAFENHVRILMLPTSSDIELYFTEKEKRTQTRKLNDFYRNQKDVGL